MHTYPHKIENGEGEVITFLGVVRDQDGDRMEVERIGQALGKPPEFIQKLTREAAELNRLGEIFATA